MEHGLNSTYTYSNNNAVTLYAVWESNTYTVAYDANGGTGEVPESQSVIKGNTMTIASSPIPSKKGYLFLGWSTSDIESATVYKGGESFKPDRDTTLYAVWKAKTITVVFHRNLTETDTTTATQTFTYGVEGQQFGYNSDRTLLVGNTKPFDTWTIDGRNMRWWNYEPNGKERDQYTDAKVTNEWIDAMTDTVHLYAVYPYRVVYAMYNMFYNLGNVGKVENQYMNYSIYNDVVTVTATRNDGYGYIPYRVYLKANTTYIFSCTTNCSIWGGNSAGDSVEAFLMLDGKDSADDIWYRMKTNKKHTFTPAVSGEYWLRLDVNQLGKTYTFEDIRIAEVVGFYDVNYGSTYGDTMPVLNREGYNFVGWFDNEYEENPLNYYADTNEDLKQEYGYDENKLYYHYNNTGKYEGRRISQYIETDIVTEDKILYGYMKEEKQDVIWFVNGTDTCGHDWYECGEGYTWVEDTDSMKLYVDSKKDVDVAIMELAVDVTNLKTIYATMSAETDTYLDNLNGLRLNYGAKKAYTIKDIQMNPSQTGKKTYVIDVSDLNGIFYLRFVAAWNTLNIYECYGEYLDVDKSKTVDILDGDIDDWTRVLLKNDNTECTDALEKKTAIERTGEEIHIVHGTDDSSMTGYYKKIDCTNFDILRLRATVDDGGSGKSFKFMIGLFDEVKHFNTIEMLVGYSNKTEGEIVNTTYDISNISGEKYLMVVAMNTRSDNLYPETTLTHLSLTQKGWGETETEVELFNYGNTGYTWINGKNLTQKSDNLYLGTDAWAYTSCKIDLTNMNTLSAYVYVEADDGVEMSLAVFSSTPTAIPEGGWTTSQAVKVNTKKPPDDNSKYYDTFMIDVSDLKGSYYIAIGHRGYPKSNWYKITLSGDTEPATNLFNYGNTGRYWYNGRKMTQNSDNLYLDTDAWGYTFRKVDLTNVSTVNAYLFLKTSHGGNLTLAVFSNKPTQIPDGGWTTSQAVKVHNKAYSADSTGHYETLSIDVSKLTGSYYIAIGHRGYAGSKWYKVWLE